MVYIFIVHRQWSIQPLATYETHRQNIICHCFLSGCSEPTTTATRVYIYHGFDRAILVLLFVCSFTPSILLSAVALFSMLLLSWCCFCCCYCLIIIMWLSICVVFYGLYIISERERVWERDCGNGIKLVDTSFVCELYFIRFKHTYTRIFTFVRAPRTHTSQIRMKTKTKSEKERQAEQESAELKKPNITHSSAYVTDSTTTPTTAAAVTATTTAAAVLASANNNGLICTERMIVSVC